MKIEDYIAVIIILALALRVSFKGFVAELSSKSGIFVGVFLIIMFFTPCFNFIDSKLEFSTLSTLIAFILLFFTGFFCTKFLLSIFQKVFEILHLDLFNHFLGFFLGAFEGAILVVAILYLLSFQNIFNPDFTNSIIVSYLQSYLPVISGFFLKIKEINYNGNLTNIGV